MCLEGQVCHTNGYDAVGVDVDACDVVEAVNVNVTVVATAVDRKDVGDAGI
jgi:hypothetical protein